MVKCEQSLQGTSGQHCLSFLLQHVTLRTTGLLKAAMSASQDVLHEDVTPGPIDAVVQIGVHRVI